MDWKFLGVFAAGAAWAASAEAQVAQIAPFVSRCVEAEATGFNWQKGKWVRVNFTPTTLLAQKFDPATHAGETSVCDSLAPDEPLVLDTFATLSGCYSAADADESPLFDWCDEYYAKADGQWRLDSIDCHWIGRQFNFRPDGAFLFDECGRPHRQAGGRLQGQSEDQPRPLPARDPPLAGVRVRTAGWRPGTCPAPRSAPWCRRAGSSASPRPCVRAGRC